jgi:polar amino acid transport system permease protein
VGLDYLFETTRYLLDGAWYSISLFAITLLIAVPSSFLIAAIYRFVPLTRKLINLYTWFFRGTPLMLQLFFFMFGLPALGIAVNRYTVAWVGFGINYTAYFIEIIRAGLEAIPKDQEESAFVMGATPSLTFRAILMPQAIKMQLPVFANESITLIKDTALVTVIAISDLLRKVREIVSRDFTVSPFFVAAGFYLLFSFLIIKVFKYLEHRFDDNH